MSYLWGCEMHELTIRTTVALNASNQQCLLPDRHLEKTEDMVKFMKDILDGAAERTESGGCQPSGCDPGYMLKPRKTRRMIKRQ
ncbi:protein disulfide-isomerase TMX3-like isoform X2 [Pogoniulus pusillus]|uniref:protein disulfide-isomerase TMX3-like isoform X2 n=1 Tax=Pogoniulus pusillus TaxID=488313 RepID=UPI0030B925F9